MFLLKENDSVLIVQIYVDDIIFGSTNSKLCKMFANLMQSEFEMSLMGELTYFLGLHIKQCTEGIYLSQGKYICELLNKYNLKDSRSVSTPMATGVQICKDENGKSVDSTKYRGMIGSLLYLTASRPDIMFAVCVCARYQADPKESHLLLVKRIFRYLRGTSELSLFYPRGQDFKLSGYCDADYSGSLDDGKSTSGSCQFLGSSLVSWSSKKQNCVALSTSESEYIAAAMCCAQILWMKTTLLDFSELDSCTSILCDNTSAINLSENPVLHSRSKHIDVRYHFLRDHVSKGNIKLEYVITENQLADIFTKPLSSERFQNLRLRLGMIILPK